MDLDAILLHNQFASGGLLLMVFGSAFAMLRHLPGQLYAWCLSRVFLDLTIYENDDAFQWIEVWLARHKYSETRARDLSVRTTRQGRRTSEMPEVIFTPAVGTHRMTWQGCYLTVFRGREEASGASDGRPGRSNLQGKEFYLLSILTRDRSVLARLMAEAYAAAHPESERLLHVRLPHYGDWSRGLVHKLRPLESVVFPAGVLEGLVADVQAFLARAAWYHQLGIPHRRGYLLYGPPGNGKSSAVMAIASALRMDICVISLNNIGMDDGALRCCFAEIPPESIVLIEDVDCVFESRERGDGATEHISFSGLLNAIDGVVASEGRLLFMTTNHIEKLDPALIRPGRCDVRLFVDNASCEQAERLFLRFFPGERELAREFAAGAAGQSVATLQGRLLRQHPDAQGASREMQETLSPATAGPSVAQSVGRPATPAEPLRSRSAPAGLEQTNMPV